MAINISFRKMTEDDKNMANGMRDTSKTPLTDDEIEYVKSQIRAIEADETKFVFNDPKHINRSTCYDFIDDIVYVTRNVFPDNKYGSIHPRDIMSVRAVLAHEYYGHRTYRDEYLNDLNKGKDFHTTEYWQDECRASMTAAEITPNLTEIDKRDLVMDTIYRADEAQQIIETTDFMKEVLYGYKRNEKNITPTVGRITYVSKESTARLRKRFENIDCLPEMQNTSNTDYFSGWEPK